ncbi:uncharacterized protein LOC111884968 [Lactuca sativa]|uniref:Uncharacterized protein n=1 Tax=Lactuca sativa TaxID=4236 RepID=A0A9R1UZ55_LACSA|nr:uncharacterized protein LOC111884968 [Lactuca sativa]KAJ0197002.1 hypothetical protein LSAT_V11C700385510 [Lactuca sativa]
MLLHNWNFSSTSSLLLHSISQSNRIDCETNCIYSRRRKLKVSSTLSSLKIGTDVIAEIAHNKVLIAAAACAAVGQLTKPFTASILYRRDFDPKVALQAGGFPSTHSSAAVASAMSLGLERGFSDSIFGIAVVYACLTMYDAQGVRREVGVHARTLNKVLNRNQFEPSSIKPLSNPESSKSPKFEETNSCKSPEWHKETTLVVTPDKIENGAISGLLKEAIGHTEIEVAAGALLGLLGSLIVYSL